MTENICMSFQFLDGLLRLRVSVQISLWLWTGSMPHLARMLNPCLALCNKCTPSLGMK